MQDPGSVAPDGTEATRQERARIALRERVLPSARKLAIREYIPFAIIAASWALFGLALGHADLVRLLAANMFIGSIRSFCTLEVTQALAHHVASERAIYKASRKLALRIDLVALAACAVAVALLVLALDLRGMEKAAAMVMIAALAIPARNPGAILVAKRDKVVSWKMGSVFWGLAGALSVLALGLNWVAAALFLALRPWAGLAVTIRWGPKRKPPSVPPGAPLEFRHAAAKTEASARKRLSYRLMRSTLSVMFGPFGNLIARTGRGLGSLDTKLANWIPRSRVGLFLIAAVTGGAAATLLWLSTEPSAFMGSAALARVAAAAGAALLWWKYGSDQIDEEDDEEE